MRNKTGVIVLASIITLLCIFYLSFTLVSRKINSEADSYATDSATGRIDVFKKRKYLDSLENQIVYNLLGIAKFTYKDVKENEINLGLDLQGGMHVTLEVSPIEILQAMSGNTDDIDFAKAIKLAQERQVNSNKSFTELFFSAYKEIAPNKKLAEVFANSANKGRIELSTPDSEVIRVIESEVTNAIDRAEKIIATRVDKFGVTQPNIQRIQGTGRIQLELPGVDNPERIRKLLSGVAKLEFLEVWDLQEVIPYVQKANDYLVKKEKAAKGLDTKKDSTSKDELFSENAVKDTTKKDNDELFADTSVKSDSTKKDSTNQEISDLFRLLRARDALVYEKIDTAKINAIFNDANVRALLPTNLRFLWSVKAVGSGEGKEFFQLYPVKKSRTSKAAITGEVIVDARQNFDQSGRVDISMQMNVEGAKKWKKMTGANINKQIAIVLDDNVYSAPVVQNEIPNGSSSITGNFTIEEAQDLANILKAGKLPAPTRIVEEAVVGPSLGAEAQIQGIISIIVGLLLVVLFMVAYYAKAGVVANLALVFNIFFIFGILAQLHAALTLPGIAGIVLTIGMSIDANVLIYERVKEELRNGKSLLAAIDLGYDRAFATILDSNLTTALIGVFLYVFGTGPIKGFAITLMVGIACSFFTAVYVTRVIMTWMTQKGENSGMSFDTAISKNLLQGVHINFLAKRKIAYITSASIIVVGMVLISIQGLNLGVDFEGGRSYIVEFSKVVVPSDLKVAISSDLENKGLEVKRFDSDNKLKITTNYLVGDESIEADEKVLAILTKAITKFTGDKYIPEASSVNKGEYTIPSTAKVGATIADDIADSSRSAFVFSLLAIFFYIWLRFRSWEFGAGAVIALFHDTLILLSIFAITRALGIAYEIDQVFVAAVLTVIGYSINDTVVVFDRVREFLGFQNNKTLEESINNSINGTLSRTLMTSFTTLLVVGILFLFGGEVLRGFSYALLVGILFGTYSSVFIATPLVYDIKQRQDKKTAVKEPLTA